MSTPADYSRPLYKAIALMKAQMEAPDNQAKKSIYEKTFVENMRNLSLNVKELKIAVLEDRANDAWRRAANVANYAWMCVVSLEAKHAEEAASVAPDDKA